MHMALFLTVHIYKIQVYSNFRLLKFPMMTNLFICLFICLCFSVCNLIHLVINANTIMNFTQTLYNISDFTLQELLLLTRENVRPQCFLRDEAS